MVGSVTAHICTLLVGCILLFFGAVKTLHSYPFLVHVRRFRLFPDRLSALVAILFIELECGLGIALILHAYPHELVPTAFMLLIILTVLTFWGTRSGRVDDCGCYGGLFRLDPRHSLLLNIGYMVLLCIAWFYSEEDYRTSMWKIWMVVVAILISHFLGKRSIMSPLLDLSRIKAGKSWNPDWLKNDDTIPVRGICFVAFLNHNCPVCEKWIALLNNMHTQAEMPKLIGVVPEKDDGDESFRQMHTIGFQLVMMERRTFNYLASQTPTAILLENGVILEKWVDGFPVRYV
ncbi:MAG: hypothetical protein GY866_16320 [Proteobacteria bacterium]|nr:hypothetical protein [Pseudomonadota bacterium]